MSSMDQIVQLYDKLYIKVLIKLIPYAGSAIDVVLKDTVDGYKKNKLRMFFDEISKSRLEITDEVIKSDDFLYCYFSTVEAVLRARRKEKIEYLARLFEAVVNFEQLKNLDEFESYLKALDDLSFREIQLLKLLHDFELRNGLKPDDHVISRLGKNRLFWEDFTREAEKVLGVPKGEINDLLIMTERAGCYISSRPQANDHRAQCGTTTKTFDHLLSIIVKSEVCG